MKEILNRRDVVWRTRHYLDYIGEVFEYKNRIYRLINKDKECYIKELFSLNIIKDLISNGWFISTKISDKICFENEEDRLILEHEYIEHVSYSYEWTCGMFLDARTLIAKINEYLLGKGYELRDPTLTNVCFIGCKPIYIDLGSIIPICEVGLSGWRTFHQYWVNPYRLVQEGRIDAGLFRALLFSDLGLSDSDLKALSRTVKMRPLGKLREVIEYRLYDNREESRRKSVRAVVDFLHSLPLFSESTILKKKKKWYARYARTVGATAKNEWGGVWSNYHDDYIKDGKAITNERFSYYMDQIRLLQEGGRVHDVFEIAGNSGVMSQLLLENQLIDYACVSDYDAGSLERGYMRCRDHKTVSDKITFSVINIMDTSERFRKFRADRYKSDLVLALAVTHHLILTQKVKLDIIVDILESYTNRYVIVEFMPLGLWSGDDNSCPPVPDWYTLDWFLEGVKEKFDVIKVEKISKNRIGILGEKRKYKI